MRRFPVSEPRGTDRPRIELAHRASRLRSPRVKTTAGWERGQNARRRRTGRQAPPGSVSLTWDGLSHRYSCGRLVVGRPARPSPPGRPQLFPWPTGDSVRRRGRFLRTPPPPLLSLAGPAFDHLPRRWDGPGRSSWEQTGAREALSALSTGSCEERRSSLAGSPSLPRLQRHGLTIWSGQARQGPDGATQPWTSVEILPAPVCSGSWLLLALGLPGPVFSFQQHSTRHMPYHYCIPPRAPLRHASFAFLPSPPAPTTGSLPAGPSPGRLDGQSHGVMAVLVAGTPPRRSPSGARHPAAGTLRVCSSPATSTALTERPPTAACPYSTEYFDRPSDSSLMRAPGRIGRRSGIDFWVPLTERHGRRLADQLGGRAGGSKVASAPLVRPAVLHPGEARPEGGARGEQRAKRRADTMVQLFSFLHSSFLAAAGGFD